MEKNSSGTLIKSALIISVSGFIAKVIGAFYRLPLTNILGSYGIGLYQMVFPFYSMLLTISATGIPSALSKLISATDDEGERRKILTAALLIIPLCGFVLSVLMAFLSGAAARLQGNGEAGLSYIAISPAVFFVSVLAVFRGFFQGRLKMMPTALSQIIEQIVKLAFGLALCKAFMPDVRLAAAGCCLAVTISEFFAAAFMIIVFKRSGRRGFVSALGEEKQLARLFVPLSRGELAEKTRSILKIALPMTFISILPPLTNLITSFYVINILKGYVENATCQYGLFSGGVSSVVSLPVALSYGVAVAILPLVVRSGKRGGGKIVLAVKYTALIAVPAFAYCFFFAGKISSVLFYNLSASEKALIARLLKVSSFTIIFLSVMQTCSSVLIGKGRVRNSAANLTVGCALDIAVSFVMLKFFKAGIISLSVSSAVCFLVAGFLNLVYSIKDEERKKFMAKELAVYFAKLTAISVLSVFAAYIFLKNAGALYAVIAGLLISAVIFVASAAFFHLFKSEELQFLKKRKKNGTDDCGDGQR